MWCEKQKVEVIKGPYAIDRGYSHREKEKKALNLNN